jgi:hypothetical protein
LNTPHSLPKAESEALADGAAAGSKQQPARYAPAHRPRGLRGATPVQILGEAAQRQANNCDTYTFVLLSHFPKHIRQKQDAP